MKPGWFADQPDERPEPAPPHTPMTEEGGQSAPTPAADEPVVELPPHPWKLRERPVTPA